VEDGVGNLRSFETVKVEAPYCFETSVIFRHFLDTIFENNVNFEDDGDPLFNP
jgi:hypothetical protein